MSQTAESMKHRELVLASGQDNSWVVRQIIDTLAPKSETDPVVVLVEVQVTGTDCIEARKAFQTLAKQEYEEDEDAFGRDIVSLLTFDFIKVPQDHESNPQRIHTPFDTGRPDEYASGAKATWTLTFPYAAPDGN